jgi:hypothetical protein
VKLEFIIFDLFLHDLKKVMGCFLVDLYLIEVIDLLHEVLLPQLKVAIAIGKLPASVLEVVDCHYQHYLPAVGDRAGL